MDLHRDLASVDAPHFAGLCGGRPVGSAAGSKMAVVAAKTRWSDVHGRDD